jgi:hypothetical protein
MGMVLVLKKASATDLKKLHERPQRVLRFLMPDEEFPVEKPAGFFAGLIASLAGKAAGSTQDITFEQIDAEEADMDKAWQGIYFLLTGDPLQGKGPGTYLMNGRPIGEVEVGYGPAWSLTPDQVRELSEHLNALSNETLLARFNGQRMDELNIYPEIWSRDPEDELKEYLADGIDSLRAYCHDSARASLGLVIYIS